MHKNTDQVLEEMIAEINARETFKATRLQELRAQGPNLWAQIEQDARTHVSAFLDHDPANYSEEAVALVWQKALKRNAYETVRVLAILREALKS
jgi:hypothetical protein